MNKKMAIGTLNEENTETLLIIKTVHGIVQHRTAVAARNVAVHNIESLVLQAMIHMPMAGTAERPVANSVCAGLTSRLLVGSMIPPKLHAAF